MRATAEEKAPLKDEPLEEHLLRWELQGSRLDPRQDCQGARAPQQGTAPREGDGGCTGCAHR